MRRLALVFALAVAAATAGCATGPATGGTSIRQAERPSLLARYGGEIAAPVLRRYVADIGATLTRAMGRPSAPFSFTVLDSPDVNAFALPHGVVYVTRGLVELASDESELAAVLAHELTHEEMGINDAAPVAGTVPKSGTMGGAHTTGRRSSATHSAHSRDEEFAADALGIRILASAGYDPHAMARILAKLRALSRLNAKLRDKSPDTTDRAGDLANHPATVARLKRARRLASELQVPEPIVERDVYLDRINGMAYGASPRQGVIHGRVFTDAALRVTFAVPEGFRLFNAPTSVVAYGPRGARIVFDRARDPGALPPQRYLTDVWGAKIALAHVESIQVNGTRGATALAHGTTKAGPVDVRLVALADGHGALFRLVYVTPKDETTRLAPALRRTTYSFARLTAGQAARIHGRRLRVVTVGPADSVESLAARMAFPDFRRERFAVLNGLPPDARLAPGMRVKIVAAE